MKLKNVLIVVNDMSNEEYAAFGVKNCQIVRYNF